MRIASEWFLAAVFLLFAVGSYIAAPLVSVFGNPESELQNFYIRGFSQSLAYAAYFFALCTALAAAYAHSRVVRHRVTQGLTYIETCFAKYPIPYTLFCFGSAAVFLFILNAQGILTGTFLIDDYEMYGIATQKSWVQLIWTPINDHVIPLFWFELKALFAVIGTTPPLLNFPLYLPAVISIGAAGILLRQLTFGTGAFAAFLAVFASTTVVGHQLYGFYAVAPYFQVLAVLMLSLVCFVRSRTEAKHSLAYLIASIVLITAAILLESGGIWAPLALAMFAIAYRLHKGGSIKKEIPVLAISVLITILYIGYLAAIPYFSDASFYGPDRVPLSLGTIYELYKVLMAGVLSSFLMPRMGLIMSQPRFENVAALWHLAMFALFAATAAAAWWTYKKGSLAARVWGLYFTLLSLGTSLIVAIARPSSHAVSFYRDQNLLFPLFFISLAFVIVGYEWVRAARDEHTKNARIAIAIGLCAIVFACQLVFSFYKEQYLGDIAFNRTLIADLQKTLVPALNELSSTTKAPLSVPALGGSFLGSNSYQLPDISEFSYFLRITNVAWVPPGRNAATSSIAFADALTRDERLRMWYLKEGEVSETCVSNPAGTNTRPRAPHSLVFDITAENAPEKIFLALSFTNDFAATGTLATVRIDQYTRAVEGDARRYVCTVNLNDIPAYTLSRNVKNMSLRVTTEGSYTLTATRVLQTGGTQPIDTGKN